MTTLGDLDEFRQAHELHGALSADVGPITPNGYSITVTCPYGVVCERWVTDVEAHRENLVQAWRVREN